jgi:uncharacterized protein (TIGR02147 family)
LVINGKRCISKDFIPKFSAALGLAKKEQQYFDALVSFNQAKTAEAKRYYLELIHNLKKDKVGKELSNEQYEYLSRWYYPVIRELVTLPHFQNDTNWIRNHLNKKVTARQVEEALSALVRLGLVTKAEDGRFIQSEGDINTDHQLTHTAAYSFHQQMLLLAHDVLATEKAENRELGGITMAVSRKQFEEIRAKIRDFQEQITTYLVNNIDVPETVMHLQLAMFPVSVNEKEAA